MRYVTSFSPQGFTLYGKSFLASFIKNVRQPIDVYIEKPCEFKHELIRYRRLDDVDGYKAFVKLSKLPAMNGILFGGSTIIVLRYTNSAVSNLHKLVQQKRNKKIRIKTG